MEPQPFYSMDVVFIYCPLPEIQARRVQGTTVVLQIGPVNLFLGEEQCPEFLSGITDALQVVMHNAQPPARGERTVAG